MTQGFLRKFQGHPVLLFFVVLTSVCAINYDSLMDKGPVGIHMWRQTDCLSITQNYYEGASFFKPELHIQLADDNTSGKSAGEFPVLYYAVSMIWKTIGVSYLSFRIFYLLILAVGLYCFYRTIKMIYKDNYWSVIITFLLFTSPIFVYYGVSFLTDAPAFSFILISGFFLAKYATDKKLTNFYLSMFFIALAGLIKASNLMFFVFLAGIFVIERFPVKTLGTKKLFANPKYELIGFGFVIMCVFSWYYYAGVYNELHQFKYTFNDIYPIWILEDQQVEPLIKGIKEVTSHAFFSRAVLFGFLFIGIFNFFLYKKIPLFAYLGNLAIIIGSLLYFFLWTPLFGNHDYYWLALLILFPAIVLPFMWYVKNSYPDLFIGFYTKVFISIFFLYNFLYCYQVVQLRTRSEVGNFVFVGDHDIVEGWRWINWDVGANWMRFEQCQGYMEEVGIKKEDKVISLPDDSFSISLYLMNHKGWTNFRHYNSGQQIDELISKGAKYLIISHPEVKEQDFLKPYLKNQIGDFKGLLFYKL